MIRTSSHGAALVGRVNDGSIEPVIGDAAAETPNARTPRATDPGGLGTTVMIVAPGVAPESDDDADHTMAFIAEALAWNFWPRMMDTPGASRRTMEFRLTDDGTQVRVPNPRNHRAFGVRRGDGPAPRGARRR